MLCQLGTVLGLKFLGILVAEFCFVLQEVKLQQLYVSYCKNKPRCDGVLQDPSKSFFDVWGCCVRPFMSPLVRLTFGLSVTSLACPSSCLPNQSVRPSVCPSVRPSICLFVCLPLCLRGLGLSLLVSLPFCLPVPCLPSLTIFFLRLNRWLMSCTSRCLPVCPLVFLLAICFASLGVRSFVYGRSVHMCETRFMRFQCV